MKLAENRSGWSHAHGRRQPEGRRCNRRVPNIGGTAREFGIGARVVEASQGGEAPYLAPQRLRKCQPLEGPDDHC
jgi:hypothetical protein